MEADLMVKGQGLQEVIESLTSALNDMKKEFDEIRDSHSALGTSWKGEASDAALTKLTALEEEGDSHLAVLRDTIKALEDALNGYSKAEETISELWSL